MDRTIFINKIKAGAIDAYKGYGVLPSLSIAQACLESNFGLSAPGNMLFGIKWREGCGYDKQLLWTHEYIDSVYTKVQAYFRKYNSFADSIADHAKLLTTNRYKPVLAAKDYKDACIKVQECGYATDPAYAKKLINIIETYELSQWDNIDEFTFEEALKIVTQKANADYDYWLKRKGIDPYFSALIAKIAKVLK